MSVEITQKLLRRYDVAGPRYTSYPTAVDWVNQIGVAEYKQELHCFAKDDRPLSLYLHIPFCESPCYFCACNRIIRKRDTDIGDAFIRTLFLEIEQVIAEIGEGKEVRLFHWGGGTPNYLEDYQIEKIHHKIDQHFTLASDAEISIEVDSRTLDHDRIRSLHELGYNRVSMGVQDFDTRVQESVNRVQSNEDIEKITKSFRHYGMKSVNYDLIYGLPYQTRESFKRTVDEVIRLKPDRIALYNFAYLPDQQPFHKKIEAHAMPMADERMGIFLDSREAFLQNGYDAIAMDHFALKEDAMARSFAEGELFRNFMGYTLKYTNDFIGFGPTSIGYVGKTFIQNEKKLHDYTQTIESGNLPIVRGLVLNDDDLIRQWTINSLMCQFKIDKKEFAQRFNTDFETYFSTETPHIKECVDQDLLNDEGAVLTVSEVGKLFIRNVCMGFDAYLRKRAPHIKFSNTI